jgi:lysozyme
LNGPSKLSRSGIAVRGRRLAVAAALFGQLVIGSALPTPATAHRAASPVAQPAAAQTAAEPPAAAEPAAAVAWTCPTEDRTTRPNNGGADATTFAVHGLDLSHWDAGVSFGRLRQAGQRFVYLKATQGTGFVDPAYRSRAATAIKNGLRVGAYHFFDYRSDGRVQADYFLRVVKARGGFAGHLRPVVDVECLTPMGRPNQARARANLRAFITEIRAHLGVRPIIYTSIFEWNTVTGGSRTFGDCLLWSAEWAQTAPLRFPPGWSRWTFWQIGPVPVAGLDGIHDADVFGGTRAQLDALRLR